VPRKATDQLGQAVYVTPTSLTFSSPSAAAQTFIGTQNFSGDQTAVVSTPACATVTPTFAPATIDPTTGGDKTVTYTVTPIAAGTCTITVTDKKGNTAAAAITVHSLLGNLYVLNASGDPSIDAFREFFAPNWTTSTTILPGLTAFGVAIDSNGNAWIAYGGGQIIEVSAVNGVIPPDPTTLTFNEANQAVGVAVDKNNNVYVVNYCYQCSGSVSELKAVNGSVPANQTPIILGSGLNLPGSVAVDSNGNVFVGETGSNRVSELVAVNGAVPPNSSFVPVGSGFNFPNGLAVDGANDLYISTGNSGSGSFVFELLAVNGTLPASPTIQTLGGGWQGLFSLTVDKSGNVFVADYTAGEVKEMPPGCMSVACVTTIIKNVPYVSALALH